MATTIEACVKEGLELQPSEQEILASEIPEFAATLKDPVSRERYLELERAARDGVVPERLVVSLEAMLELLLQTQGVRRRHGPDAAHVLLSELFYRTPRGSGLRQSARDVTRALEALRGQVVEKVSVMAGPGRHTVVFQMDRCRLTLKLDGSGAQVDKVEVGG